MFDLLHELKTYQTTDATESLMVLQTIQFVERNLDHLFRSCLSGHITGGAFIVNENRDKTLLTHHAKLKKWLQLGGHADGQPDIRIVAGREAWEESGLQLNLMYEGIFDVDTHPIPASPSVPAHLHYDIRFLFFGNDTLKLRVSNESLALAWVSFDKLSGDPSFDRMIKKAVRY